MNKEQNPEDISDCKQKQQENLTYQQQQVNLDNFLEEKSFKSNEVNIDEHILKLTTINDAKTIPTTITTETTITIVQNPIINEEIHDKNILTNSSANQNLIEHKNQVVIIDAVNTGAVSAATSPAIMLPETEKSAATNRTTTNKSGNSVASNATTTVIGNASADVAVVAETAVDDDIFASDISTIPTTTNHAQQNEGRQLTAVASESVQETTSPNEAHLSATTTTTKSTTITGTDDALSSSSLQSLIQSLIHTTSEPTFGTQTRTQQQQKIKNYHDAKQTTVWRTDSIATSNNSNNDCNLNANNPSGGNNIVISAILKSASAATCGTTSGSTSPCMLRKSSDIIASLPRRVSFPKSDKELVTGYLEPANPWEHAFLVKSISEIAELYVKSCQRHCSKPLQSILDHLKTVDLNKQLRQPLLSLKSIKLTPNDCEPLEEVFKRVQYKTLDLSECELDESAVSALFQMIEYYEAANELDISSNPRGMTQRGWVSCVYMVSRSQELQVLNVEGNPISKVSAENLGHALGTSNLHTIKLEHCGLKGAPLNGLCIKLRSNKVLRELWLAYNDLDCDDAVNIADLLRINHYLELVDLSNNNIKDTGLRSIVEALISQSQELERRSMLHRSAAVCCDDGDDDDGSLSPIETTPPPCELHQTNISSSYTEESTNLRENAKNDVALASGDSIGTQTLIATEVNVIGSAPKLSKVNERSDEMEQLTPTQSLVEIVNVELVDNDADDNDTDETVRLPVSASTSSIKNSANQNPGATAGGQSMLDKLLSMNSDSSSDDGASINNLSTDTLAACCSDDTSIISDDIFDIVSNNGIANMSTNARATAAPQTSTATTIAAENNMPCIMAVATTTTTNGTTPPTTTKQKNVNDNNICDNFLSEAINVEPECNSINDGMVGNALKTTTSSPTTSASMLANNHNNVNNNNHLSKNSSQQSSPHQLSSLREESLLQTSDIFEVTAEESDCINSGEIIRGDSGESALLQLQLQQNSTKPLDVNKNTNLVGDDYDDTHSMDSAFESASEGDISRHLPDDFSRLSASLESTRIDDLATKEITIETGTIATESTECLVETDEAVTPSSTPTPTSIFETSTISSTIPTTATTINCIGRRDDNVDEDDDNVFTTVTSTSNIKVNNAPSTNISTIVSTLPKVTIASDCPLSKNSPTTSPTPTPPPPSTSPGGASLGMRRTESTCTFLMQSSRNRSQSTDSLCSDNSLDSSISNDVNFSDKWTKNDTLSRQQQRQQMGTTAEFTPKAPSGLKALAIWSNNLTKESGPHIANLLSKTVSLELLNIGKNCLSNDFVTAIKDSLTKNSTVTTLGLQSAHLSAKGIETLSSILTFGGNSKLQRIDIRDNKLEVESLSTIAEVLKSNKTITQIDIDDEPKRLSVGSDAHLDYTRVLANVRSMCSRNEKIQSQQQAEKTAASVCGTGATGGTKSRGGYYLGSRKISLTCHSRPLVDKSTNSVSANLAVSTATKATPTSVAKLEVKRKSGARLRSPVPSPPTTSPSSSPNRSRFQVFRVSEVSPLTSPLAQTPPPTPHATTNTSSSIAASSCVAIPTATASCDSSDYQQRQQITSISLPTSSSMPSMATATSSTQTIKRLSASSRSRFQVSKIYEDPRIPLSHRPMPPITPPLNPPPTPMLPSSRRSVSTVAADAVNAAAASEDVVTIVEPANTVTATTTISPAITDHNSTNVKAIKNSVDPKLLSTHDSSSDNLSPLSSSSSSSLTSPASSTSSVSSSNSTCSASSITSSRDVTSSSSDSTDDSTTTYRMRLGDLPKNCPIAVFGDNDNDITLTKNSAGSNDSLLVSGGADAPDCSKTKSEPEIDDANATAQQTQPTVPQRARKVSWIANPTSVDKLLTLFSVPSGIFQRSSSPESKSTATVQTINPLGNNSADSNQARQPSQQQQQQQQQPNTVVATRKTSPPSWSKLGSDILSTGVAIANENVNSNANNSVNANSSTTTTNSATSFFDAASRQIRDFGKQVFRPNLTFGSDSNSVTNVSIAPSSTTTSTDTLIATDNGTTAAETAPGCDAALIPTNLKLEVKENISPEHTINEETLHSLQKLSATEENFSERELLVAIHEKRTDSCTEEIPPIEQEEASTIEAAAAVVATYDA